MRLHLLMVAAVCCLSISARLQSCMIGPNTAVTCSTGNGHHELQQQMLAEGRELFKP